MRQPCLTLYTQTDCVFVPLAETATIIRLLTDGYTIGTGFVRTITEENENE